MLDFDINSQLCFEQQAQKIMTKIKYGLNQSQKFKHKMVNTAYQSENSVLLL